ncbi:SRSO17 transposase [Paraburkholderia sp. MM5477-R1]
MTAPEFGLGHFEGRSWRGFHHHASLCIAAYGFLVTQRLIQGAAKKNFAVGSFSTLPDDYVPRGSPTRPTARG